MTIKQATLDGRYISFTDCTEFFVQLGKGKSSYRTRYSFTGDLSKAVFYFNAINIGNGYKKRLVAPAFNKPLLARQFS